MRSAALALLLLSRPAAAAEWRLSQKLAAGGGRSQTEDLSAGVLTSSGRWDLSTRVKSFRCMDAFNGSETEYSARLERHLPHVSIATRLGTAPPGAQRAAYHLAAGEILFTLYGLKLGPQDLKTAATVSEDTTTAALFEGLDTTWVTRFKGVYTNTNHHHEPVSHTGQLFYLVQNSWQFEVSETWKKRTTLALRGGGIRYSKLMRASDPAWYMLNTDYAGNPLAVRGWPNTHIGADLTQKLGDWTMTTDFTRLNMLFGGLEALVGAQASWRPRGGPLEVSLGWRHRHRRHHETREAWSFGASYRW